MSVEAKCCLQFLVGIVSTAVVVVGIAALTLWLLIK